MQKLLDLVEGLAEVFDRLEVPHAFGGALANNYWGVVRTTVDVDCLVATPALKYQELADELTHLGCVMHNNLGEEMPIDVAHIRGQEQQQRFFEIFWQSIRAEIFVPFLPIQKEILRRAVNCPLRNRAVSITTAEDLILLKMAFHRLKDVQDIRGIIWTQREKLDLAYLRQWSRQMLENEAQQELEALLEEYDARDES